jgi:hypothetical protein
MDWQQIAEQLAHHLLRWPKSNAFACELIPSIKKILWDGLRQPALPTESGSPSAVLFLTPRQGSPRISGVTSDVILDSFALANWVCLTHPSPQRPNSQ